MTNWVVFALAVLGKRGFDIDIFNYRTDDSACRLNVSHHPLYRERLSLSEKQRENNIMSLNIPVIFHQAIPLAFPHEREQVSTVSDKLHPSHSLAI